MFPPTFSFVRQTAVVRFIVDNISTILIVCVATLAYSWISIFKHINFQSNAFDLAIFSQTSWLLSHFNEPFSTVRMLLQPADHFTPTYWLLSMGYGLFNSPVYLLVLQIGSVLLGAIPVWKLSKQALSSRYAADFLLIAYFFQISVISGLAFDFSTTTLSIGFTAWAIYFYDKQRLLPYLIFFLFALGCKEDMPILFGAFSLLMLYRRQWRWFAITMLVSVGWYMAVMYYIMPIFLQHPNEYTRFGNPLEGFATKEASIRQIFIQNLGFTLLDPLGILFVGANLLIRFLKTGANYWSNNFHYGANVAAPMIISAAFGIKFFIRKTGIEAKTAATLIALAMAIVTVITTGPLLNKVKVLPVSRDSINATIAQIPATASISAQSSLAPHLSNRVDLYLFPRTTIRCPHVDCPSVDYIVLNNHLGSWPLTTEELNEKLTELKQDANFTLFVESHDGTYIFKNVAL